MTFPDIIEAMRANSQYITLPIVGLEDAAKVAKGLIVDAIDEERRRILDALKIRNFGGANSQINIGRFDINVSNDCAEALSALIKGED